MASAALQGWLLPLLTSKLDGINAEVAAKAAQSGQADLRMAARRAARVEGQQQLPDGQPLERGRLQPL